jgi:hypothetical protein
MRQPRANTFLVAKLPYDPDVIATVLFIDTRGAHFSLYAVLEPESEQRGGPLMQVDDREPLHAKLLSGAHALPGARLAYFVHELGGPDHEPAGRVVINLLDQCGALKGGCITIEIPRGQVAAGYIHFVDEETLEARSEWRRKDEGEGDDVDEGEGEDENEEI